MADKKISALTGASTPLAGTEVLPIVQSGATVKVATDDLTVKNVRSNTTSGILQVTGPAAAATRVMTTPDANFSAARIDAAQSFTGDQTLATGNLIQGTASKGFNFTANTAAAGMTSKLLNDYEQGTFTPAFDFTTGSITYGAQDGAYIKVGKQVYLQMYIRWSARSSPVNTNMTISGIPFAIGSRGRPSGLVVGGPVTYTGVAALWSYPGQSVLYVQQNNGGAVSNMSAASFFSADSAELFLSFTYVSA